MIFEGLTNFVSKQVTKVALYSEWGQDQVRAELKSSIEEQFADISKKLKTAKSAFAKDKELKHLSSTCDALLKQATAIKTYLLQKPQFDALTDIAVSKGKEYGSVDEIKDKFYKGNSFKQLKALVLELLSADIYNNLLPLMDTDGQFEKLDIDAQLALVTVLENDKSLDKVKALNLTDTFTKLQTQAQKVGVEFGLNANQQAAINRMIDHVKAKHLPDLQKIKKASEKDLPKLKQRLLAHVHESYPHLAVAQSKPKPVIHTEKKAKKEVKKEGASSKIRVVKKNK